MSRSIQSASAWSVLAFASIFGPGIVARGQVVMAPYDAPAVPPTATQLPGDAPRYDTTPPLGEYQYPGGWNSSAPCAPYGSLPAATQPCNPCVEPVPPATTYLPPIDECASPYVWVGSVGALLLARDDGNHYFFSYDSAIEIFQILDSRDADFGVTAGAEARIVRFDTCTCMGIEGVYWGQFPTQESAYAYADDVIGDLNPILNYDQIDYNGSPGNAFVNKAMVHRLQRESEIHNVEINLLRGLPADDGGCSPWIFCGAAGFRYFRFEESLEFAADTVDTVFTCDPNELYYNIDVENNLFGLQLGGAAERRVGERWSFSLGAKSGVFANSASADSRIGGAAGVATVNNGPNDGLAWLVPADKVDVAFLGEVHAGLACRISQTWRVIGEYRALSASAVSHCRRTRSIPTCAASATSRCLRPMETSSSMARL